MLMLMLDMRRGSIARDQAIPTTSESKKYILPPTSPILQVSTLNQSGSGNQDTPISFTKNFPTLNARSGTPFETELFKGELLLIIRPPDPVHDDPYYNERIFSKKKRMVSKLNLMHCICIDMNQVAMRTHASLTNSTICIT